MAGEARGVTPLTTEVMAGNQPLELKLEGFKAWTTDIQVKANEAMTVGPVRLGLPDGRLSLRSEPSGASVTISVSTRLRNWRKRFDRRACARPRSSP